jgi:plasmid stabilization system protein ParE
MRILYSRHFIADLDGIADYIRLDNPTRAISFVEELKMVCREIIAVHPRIGRRRSGLGVDRRSFQTHGRVIYYSFDAKTEALRFDRILGRQNPTLD